MIGQISNNERALQPIFEARASCNNSLIERMGEAFGSVFSQMGFLTFAAGLALASLFLVPVSFGAAQLPILTMPAYLAAAGGLGLLVGELVRSLSGRQVAHLTFSA